MWSVVKAWIQGSAHLREERTRAMRLLAAVSGGSYLPLWYIASYHHGLFDPFVPRLAYVLVALGWVFASYISKRVAFGAHLVGAILLPYATIHMYALAAINQLDDFYQTGVVLTVGIAAALGPSVNIKPRVLFMYYAICMAAGVAIVFGQSEVVLEARGTNFLIPVMVICALGMVVVRMNDRMSDRLWAAEQKLQKTVEAAPISIVTFNRNHVCTFAEGRGLHALRLTSSDLVGRSVSESLSSVERMMEIYQDVSKGMEFSGVVNHDEAVFEIWWGQGREGTVLVATDISKRRRLEQALVRTETRLWATFEALRDSVVSINLQGQIFETRCHGALLAHGGLKKTPKLLRLICTHLQEALHENQWRTFEYTLESADRVHFEVRVVPAGEYEGVALIRDITDQKKLQDRMVVSDRMASLGTLAAGVAHEINNPLSYLFGNLTYLKELLEELPNAHTDDFSRALSDASEGAERIREIVGDLQAFSSPVDDEVACSDIAAVLDRAIELTRAEIHHRGQLIRKMQLPLWVRGNQGRLGQLFVNLLVNAAHAISEGHSHENSITVSCRAESGRVTVEISDTGQGMEADTRRRVFDPFFTTKAVGQGTGLGLFVCHRIVESVGGSISIDSVVGKGTTIRVDLLQAPTPAEATEQVSRHVADGVQRLNILVVDDDAAVTRLLVRCLRRHDVTVATSGEHALEILNNHDFQIVLCDLMMPGLGGPGFYAEALKLHPKLCDHVGFMTAGAFTLEAEQFLAEVNPPVLNKPFDPQLLEPWLKRLAHAEHDGL